MTHNLLTNRSMTNKINKPSNPQGCASGKGDMCSEGLQTGPSRVSLENIATLEKGSSGLLYPTTSCEIR